VIHNSCKVERHFCEHSVFFIFDNPRVAWNWKKSPSRIIKLSVDALVTSEKASIAVIARDDKGEMLKA
jgi:hypothetical protein